jgi:3-oxoacyl-[acyl-carrier-protein] synthase II
MKTDHDKIAVTGLAAVSSAGVGTKSLLEALNEGKIRLRPAPEELTGAGGYQWGRAEDFKVSEFMPPLKARKFDRCSLFAIVAARMAINHAGIDVAKIDPTRVGVMLGCGFGGIANSGDFLSGYFTRGAEGLAPMLFPNTVPNAPASNTSIELGLKGPNVTTVQRFCSAESAVMMACRFIEEGRADIILAGGVDELNPLLLKGFASAGQLRGHAKGFGEGTGILVLEKMDHAIARKAEVLAEIGDIRTIGRLVRDAGAEGMSRLLGPAKEYSLLSLSGVAAEMEQINEAFPSSSRIDIGKILGRSLAMGGLAMVSLVLSLSADQDAVHLAASPEGPYYAIDFKGGSSVQS